MYSTTPGLHYLLCQGQVKSCFFSSLMGRPLAFIVHKLSLRERERKRESVWVCVHTLGEWTKRPLGLVHKTNP